MKSNIIETEKFISPDEITRLIDAKLYRELKASIEYIPALDISEIFSELPKEYHTILFRLLPKELAADVFVEMDSEITENLINSFNDRELADIISQLYLDDTVDIIEEMPASVVKRILS